MDEAIPRIPLWGWRVERYGKTADVGAGYGVLSKYANGMALFDARVTKGDQNLVSLPSLDLHTRQP